mgnify:FL=1
MNTYYLIASLIKYFTILLELLLGIRVILKFLGASAKAEIVQLVYGISDFFIAPFKFIFQNISIGEGIIDLVAISAIIGYFILVLIILKLLKIIFLKHY